MPGKTTRKVGKKQMKAMGASNNVAKTFKLKLKKGNNVDNMMLAKVVSVSGGGRFVVKDVNGLEHSVRVSKALFIKAARHRNTKIPVAVRIDSNVIIVDGVIRSVIGDAEAKSLRALLKVGNNNTNSVFTYSNRSRSSRSSKNTKSSSSRKSMKSNKGSRRMKKQKSF